MIRRNRVYISKIIGGVFAAWLFISGGVQLLKTESDGRIAGIMLITLSVIIAMVALVSTATAIRRTKRISYLMAHGQRQHGTVSHFSLMRVHNSHIGYSYRVIVEGKNEKGDSFSYSSDPVSGSRNLGFLLHHQVQVPATVFVNPENKKEYYVDIDALSATIEEKMKEFFNK